jgi:hypothetical protein
MRCPSSSRSLSCFYDRDLTADEAVERDELAAAKSAEVAPITEAIEKRNHFDLQSAGREATCDEANRDVVRAHDAESRGQFDRSRKLRRRGYAKAAAAMRRQGQAGSSAATAHSRLAEFFAEAGDNELAAGAREKASFYATTAAESAASAARFSAAARDLAVSFIAPRRGTILSRPTRTGRNACVGRTQRSTRTTSGTKRSSVSSDPDPGEPSRSSGSVAPPRFRICAATFAQSQLRWTCASLFGRWEER